nr:MAG TPA: hypothetical protein [Caudoviricetes sp.]
MFVLPLVLPLIFTFRKDTIQNLLSYSKIKASQGFQF